MFAAQMKNKSGDLPQHVAIIMDGNGRWAHRKNLTAIAGHRAGADALQRVIKHAASLNISYLTVFAFSTENWNRPTFWIDELMGLLKHYLKNQVTQLIDNNIKVTVIGDRQKLCPEIRLLVEELEYKTANNSGLNLNIALSYSGRQDIAFATKTIIQKVQQGKINVDQIDENLITQHLSTSSIPDPDLLIRTSGEWRISNFLLWQMAYAELIFVDKLWPDFDAADLDAAILTFQSRERRYGAVIGK